jgi:hypothetical protein
MIKVYYSGAGYEPEEAIEFNTITEAEVDLMDYCKTCDAMETQIADTSNDDEYMVVWTAKLVPTGEKWVIGED